MNSRTLLFLLCSAALPACDEPSVESLLEQGVQEYDAFSDASMAMTPAPASAKRYKTAVELYGPLSVQEGTFSAVTPVKPWSSWWFPMRDDFLHASRDGNPSPLERYDRFALQAFHRVTNAAAYEREHVYDSRAANWAGRCGAWALASILAPEPTLPVTRSGVYFRVADLKALLVETFDNVPGLTEIGMRNEGAWDDDYADLLPDQLHRVVQARLFQQKKPFIIDSDAGIEVWHEPIYKVTTTLTRDNTQTDVVHVRTFLGGASARVTDMDATGTLDVYREYTYDLKGTWTDQGMFNVQSGRWTGRSRWDHPDYVLLPPDTLVQRSSMNPHIDLATVQAILGR